MENSRMRIMIVEDDPAHAEAIRRALEVFGAIDGIQVAGSLREFRAAVADNPPDIVLVDLNLPDGRAVEVLSSPPESGQFPILIMTSYGNEQTAVEALKGGALDYVVKSPAAFAELPRTVARSLREWKLLQERKQAEIELRESNERFSMIFEHSIDAIMLTLTDGTILAANPEACRVFGMSEEDICRVGRAGLVDIEDARAVELLEQRNRLGYCRGDITMIRGDGSRFPADISSAVFSDSEGIQKTSLVIRDVTERRSLENQLRQAQKIEAIGQLAGGVAHDFNNILSAILGYSQLILDQENVDDAVKNHVEEIVTASNRAADLTRSLLAFSRKQPVSLTVIDLNELIRNNEKFLRRLIREDIELKINCTGEPLTVLADRGQIEQVLMNLIANARDAMPNGGTLLIETQPAINLDKKYFETHGYYGNAGEYAEFSVSDSGEGMDKETQLHIFEPFFTTKEQGKGTGLGLAMAYGTVKKHNGFINVYSEPGEGTIFKIYLPRVQATAQVVELVPEKQAPLRGGAETILVGEDDAALRRLSTRVLNHFGYRVIEAVDGQDAVDKFMEQGESIRLVILDAIMPKKNGRDACLEMRMVRPDLKAVFVSGYARDIFTDGNALDGNSIFIQKPVTPNDLAEKVRELLDK